jgi:predicted oxidoreductase
MTLDPFVVAGANLTGDAASEHRLRLLGKSGLQIPALAWGMWRLEGEPGPARRLVETALDAGITLLDTAEIYGTQFAEAERIFGGVLAQAPELRQRMVLATKGGIIPGVPYCSSKDYLIAACEGSLQRLGVEQIDLYQVHRPDHLTHPAEVAEAFSRLRDAGKIAAAGVSNYTVAQTRALMAHMDFPLASLQPEFSALAIDALYDGVLDLAVEAGLAVLAWSPLGRGSIATGTGLPRAAEVVAELDRLAAREGVSRTAVAYAWIMAHPARPVPIVGSQQPARIVEACDALRVRLNRADWYAVLTAARGVPLP